jgi:hypothetical protein
MAIEGRSMQFARRTFLTGLVALPLVARAGLAAAGAPRYLSCADDRDRKHYAVGFQSDGTITYKIALPARGHGFALHPAGRHAIVFGRRPGSYAAVIDPVSGTSIAMIDPPTARCFYGHGTYSADGRLLYVCEHDDASGNGFIGIYDVTRDYRRVGDFGAGGIGPHEVRLMPDGRTLVVAVGGIMTDHERDMLNIDTMDPSLAYLDAASGAVLEQVRPPTEWHQLSIRHIDLDAQGRVAIAMQYEGDPADSVPLAALHARGQQQLQFLRAGEEDEMRLKQYLGDIAFDPQGKIIAATSPVGSSIALWDARSGDYIEMTDASDGCGIAGVGDGFVVTAGDGRIRHVDEDTNEPLAATPWSWDNHFIAVA